LAKDPDDRYQTIKDVAIELRELRREIANTAGVDTTVAPSEQSGVAPSGGIASGVTLPPKGATPSTNPISSAEYVVAQIKSHRKAFVFTLLLAVAAFAGAGLVFYKFLGRDQSARSGAPLKVTPLTSSPYIERNVALSPDGKQVAFVWTGEKNDNFDLYVKIIGAGEPLQLTNSPGFEMSPAWSPDGRFIAFQRARGESKGLYLIPALRGAERKLADTQAWGGPPRPQGLDWSPDGKMIALSDATSEKEPWSIFLLSVETGERRKLTQPATNPGDMLVSFSPDSSRVAFVRRYDQAEGDIYTVPVTGGEPTRITKDGVGVHGLAWTPDGASIVFSSERGGGDPTLWRVPAAGGTPAPVLGVGEDILELSIARQGNRMAYAQRTVDPNIYRLNLTNEAGRLSAGAPVSFIASTRLERTPAISPDGRRVALMSNRSGSAEIWACDAEGKNPVPLTSFGGPYTDQPSWSPDGRHIAFTSRAGGNTHIWVVGADGGSPRRLTTEDPTEEQPSWSRDGHWIYFVSNRTEPEDVWKMPAAGGATVQLTRGGGLNPQESIDGRTLYYLKMGKDRGLWQVGVEGGAETRVLDANVNERNWAVAGRGIYFFTSQPRETPFTLEFFDFATHQTTPIKTIDGPRGTFQISALTVSPDERWVLYAQRDKLDFDLMLVENFR
jgi:Tol biopolymer transport system component